MAPPETTTADEQVASAGQRSSGQKFLLLFCLLGGIFAGFFFLGPLGSAQREAVGTELIDGPQSSSSALSNVQQPNKSLMPKEVVEVQMKALARYQDNREAIHQVFAFASPANQAVTGPIKKFEQMIMSEPYYSMVDCQHWMVGRTVEKGGIATLLVTTIDSKDRVSVYRFYLSKQTDQCPGCWMTDRVLCLFQSEDTPTTSI